MWKSKKALTAGLCLVACLSVMPTNALAATPYAQPVAVHDTGIMPLFEYINDCKCRLTISGSTLTINASVSGNFSLATKCSIKVELQEKSLLTWKTVATWSDTQDSFRAGVNDSYAVSVGKSYRAVATVTVWSGSDAETQTVISDTVKA